MEAGGQVSRCRVTKPQGLVRCRSPGQLPGLALTPLPCRAVGGFWCPLEPPWPPPCGGAGVDMHPVVVLLGLAAQCRGLAVVGDPQCMDDLDPGVQRACLTFTLVL